MIATEVRALQEDLHALGYADLVRPSGEMDAGTHTAMKCFQRDAGLPAGSDVRAALRYHRREGWVAQAAEHAARILVLAGRKLRVADAVRAELEAATRREPVRHPCDPAGVFLHPFMLEMVLALSEVCAFEIAVLRATHGKYQKIDDLTVCEAEGAIVSSHYLGQGVDFYRIGASVDALVSRDDGEEAWLEAADRLVRPYWEGALPVPPGYWVVFPLGLQERYSGVRDGVKYFSNDRHWNHCHLGLNMNVPRI